MIEHPFIDSLIEKEVEAEMKEYARSLCEWNPSLNVLATDPPEPGDCINRAAVVIGHDGKYHLCDSCAALPVFKRYRSRVRL